MGERHSTMVARAVKVDSEEVALKYIVAFIEPSVAALTLRSRLLYATPETVDTATRILRVMGVSPILQMVESGYTIRATSERAVFWVPYAEDLNCVTGLVREGDILFSIDGCGTPPPYNNVTVVYPCSACAPTFKMATVVMGDEHIGKLNADKPGTNTLIGMFSELPSARRCDTNAFDFDPDDLKFLDSDGVEANAFAKVATKCDQMWLLSYIPCVADYETLLRVRVVLHW